MRPPKSAYRRRKKNKNETRGLAFFFASGRGLGLGWGNQGFRAPPVWIAGRPKKKIRVRKRVMRTQTLPLRAYGLVAAAIFVPLTLNTQKKDEARIRIEIHGRPSVKGLES